MSDGESSEGMAGELDAMNKVLSDLNSEGTDDKSETKETGEESEETGGTDEASEKDSKEGEEGNEAEKDEEDGSEEDDEGSKDESSKDKDEEAEKDAKKGEKAESDKESGESTDLKAEIIALKSELANLKAEKGEETGEKKPDAKSEGDEDKDQDFVKDLDLDELARDPDEFNKVLNNIRREAKKSAESAIMKRMPEMVNNQVSVVLQMQAAADNFLSENEDIRGFPKVVQAVYAELAEKAPKDATIGAVLKDTAVEVRKRLGLPEPEPDKKKEKGDKTVTKKSDSPKLPQKKGSSGKAGDKPKPDALESELDAMTKVMKG